jgi:GNAT superfamily N-acetyltransferase
MKATLIPLEATIPLRLRVLRPGGTEADCHFPSDDVPGAFHVGTFHEEQCVAVGSFSAEAHADLPAQRPYRLRGMASAPEVRGRGAGRVLLDHAVELLGQRGCDVLWCNARVAAIPFYERMGFIGMGPLFDIPGIGPHQMMHRPIGRVG